MLALSQERVGVARTGAVVSGAPLVGVLAAAASLGEPLTVVVLVGVVVVVGGVALLSLSGLNRDRPGGHRPWHALAVAGLWGTSPLLIRRGLQGIDSPILGLTVGIGAAVLAYGVGLYLLRRRRPDDVSTFSRRALPWVMLGGVTGAIAISAQWISFGLTTIAISLSVQQLAAPVVVALVPLTFREPMERVNLHLIIGTAAIVGGTTMVVLSGN